MRINVFLASATGLSRRGADAAVAAGKVRVNGHIAQQGQQVEPHDEIRLANVIVTLANHHHTIMLNKPVGYVCSRAGQGSKTVYDLLPPAYHRLKTVGRLDKNSSGLLLLTDDGQLAHELTHPSRQKEKVYHVTLDREITKADLKIIGQGVLLEDGLSKLTVKVIESVSYEIRMHEGRNRQIRRTFTSLGYHVQKLHRTAFGSYSLGLLATGEYQIV